MSFLPVVFLLSRPFPTQCNAAVTTVGSEKPRTFFTVRSTHGLSSSTSRLGRDMMGENLTNRQNAILTSQTCFSFTLIGNTHGLVALLYKESSVIVLNVLLWLFSRSHIFNDKLRNSRKMVFIIYICDYNWCMHNYTFSTIHLTAPFYKTHFE